MRTIVWFTYFVLVLIWYLPAFFKAKRLHRQGETAKLDACLDRWAKDWAKSLLRLAGVEVEVSGLENIPQVPVVFVSNHQGNFDIPVLLSYLDRPHGFVAKIETKKIPVIRTWMQYLGCVFLDRENPRQAMGAIGEAAEIVRQGHSIILFPEGTRSKGDRMRDFQSGGLRIATKAKAPVVPLVINGTYRAMEAHGSRIHPAKVRLTILPPVDVPAMDRQEQKELPEKLHGLIQTELSRQLGQ